MSRDLLRIAREVPNFASYLGCRKLVAYNVPVVLEYLLIVS